MKPNMWFVGILMGLVLTVTGWGIRQFEKNDDNLLYRVEALEQDNERLKAQFEEIINRLERIERGIDNGFEESRRRSSKGGGRVPES